jgi:hypothetical protein
MKQRLIVLPPQEAGDQAAFARALIMVARRLVQQQIHMVQSPPTNRAK